MGIQMSTTDENAGRAAFSQDILKIVINGPDVSSTSYILRLSLYS